MSNFKQIKIKINSILFQSKLQLKTPKKSNQIKKNSNIKIALFIKVVI